MEDQQGEGESPGPNSPSQGSSSSAESSRTEPVRSRWTPKPEQILILESIFNSGMVNPPKEETVRIRKLLEKFGAVGDANVFYWFQNRRSRSRRRQRQMQASAAQLSVGGGANPYGHQQIFNNNSVTSASAAAAMGFGGASSTFSVNSSSPYYLSGSPSSYGGGGGGFQEGLGGFFSGSAQMGFPEIDHNSAGSSSSSVLFPSDHAQNLNNNSGFGGNNNISGLITVFINGVATEVPRGPMDTKIVFGEDVMLVHSSGLSLPTNEYGFLMQSLQPGESYFLVSKQTQV